MKENIGKVSLKKRLGRFLSRIGNKLQDKPNLLLTPNIGPIIQYNTDKFELIQAQYKASTIGLEKLKLYNIDDYFDRHIRIQLANEIANKILERHIDSVEINTDGGDYMIYSLRLLVSKPKNEI